MEPQVADIHAEISHTKQEILEVKEQVRTAAGQNEKLLHLQRLNTLQQHLNTLDQQKLELLKQSGAAGSTAGDFPVYRWVPPLLVVLVTAVLLVASVLKHGWAALTPTPFWGWLGLWGVWGAAVTALELKQPWLWLVQLLARVVSWVTEKLKVMVMVMMISVLVGGMVVLLLYKSGVLIRA